MHTFGPSLLNAQQSSRVCYKLHQGLTPDPRRNPSGSIGSNGVTTSRPAFFSSRGPSPLPPCRPLMVVLLPARRGLAPTAASSSSLAAGRAPSRSPFTVKRALRNQQQRQ